MSRLPPRPDLAWKDDGTPSDRRMDDVYYSMQDGLSESRAVFVSGCGLPERWQAGGDITIAELGFGTGLNVLAAWQLWRESRPPEGWLHIVSFEGFPLEREDALRALSAWPELAELATKLGEAWPERAFGVQQAVWPEERVSLTLHIGDIADTLPRASFSADAWFLDGFSPAKNEAMWADTLWGEIAQRSKPDARAATFTVAGRVRRGLQSAGFEVEKAPGHGRKRERLEARLHTVPERAPDLYGLRAPDQPVSSVRILGAGIAGASLARRLLERGFGVRVEDCAPRLATGASGNRLALVMPRLDAGDTVEARLLIDAYLSALAFYRGRPGVETVEVVQRPRNEGEAERFAKLLADPPLGLEHLEALRGGGLLHKQALILRPHVLIPHLLEGAEVRVSAPSERLMPDPGEALVFANGMGLSALVPRLDLEARLGQVEHVETGPALQTPSALASGHYAVATGRDRLWGATFERHSGEAAETSEAARASNMEALRALDPYWRQAAERGDIFSRAGIRATTPDRLPLIGALPDFDAAAEQLAGLKTGQPVNADAPLEERLFVSGGFGSRGFTWGPWAGAILAARLGGDPAPASLDALRAVSPMRQVIRRLKRGG